MRRRGESFEAKLALVLDGRIKFDEFARAARGDFERMAAYLARRWVPPSWCSREDLVQELMLGAWLHVWSFYDPDADRSLARFVVYNAISHAKRALHKARGALLHGSADRARSCFERPLSSYGREDGDGEAMAERFLAEEAEAERRLIEAEDMVEALACADRHCETEDEREAVRAVARAGSLAGGGGIVYADFGRRIKLRLGSEAVAERHVARQVAAVVKRMGSAS